MVENMKEAKIAQALRTYELEIIKKCGAIGETPNTKYTHTHTHSLPEKQTQCVAPTTDGSMTFGI